MKYFSTKRQGGVGKGGKILIPLHLCGESVRIGLLFPFVWVSLKFHIIKCLNPPPTPRVSTVQFVPKQGTFRVRYEPAMCVSRARLTQCHQTPLWVRETPA